MMKRILPLWFEIPPILPLSKGGVKYPPFAKGEEGGFGGVVPFGFGVPLQKLFALFFIVFLLIAGTAHALPAYDQVRNSYVKSDSLLLDRHGEVLQELRVDKARRRLDWTSLYNISPALQEAVIQAEDRRFYDHRGVDYRSMGAAVLQGLTTESLRGASTITMQLASFLNRELQSKKGRRSVWQKGRQVIEAWEIEETWSKAHILEAYLNLVTFRGELQGIMAASRGLFGKDPHGLDRAESLVLASLIRSPNAPSQEINQRASYISKRVGWNTGEEEILSKVKQIFLGPNVPRPRMSLAPHAARRLFHESPNTRTVNSTLDHQIQRFAMDRLAHHLLFLKSQNVKDGAILIMENKTGDVLAYVSHSGEPMHSRHVDGVQAKRQAGSTLKPFLYGLAFDQRILTPASLLDDSPLDVAVIRGIYRPNNYDSQFKGWVTARMALASSLNVPAVKTLSLVGLEPFLNRLRLFEIRGLQESGDFYGPSLALGSVDVSLWELVNAYRALANGGTWSEPRLVLDGKTSFAQRQVLSKEAAFLVSDILSDREARSMTFGLESPLASRFWTAVKTGTSKDMRDNWCIGYSKQYTVGVWIGNFSGEPMWNVSGVTGAAPLWAEMMNFLHRNGVSAEGKIPARVVSREIVFSQASASRRREWFIRGTEPNSRVQKTGQLNQRIVYPPSGTVIALDPDIPVEQQRVFFISQTHEEGFQWRLDDKTLQAVGKTISWTPRAGRFELAIADRDGKILDFVYFHVRGAEEAQTFLHEMNEYAN